MATDGGSKQYLTFRLGEEVFALEIGKVREVLDFTRVTKVPGAPEFMRGVINLRGSVVPVVDMRLKFGMNDSDRTVNTCIILVEFALDGESKILGALADSVQEVLEMGPDQIEPPPPDRYASQHPVHSGDGQMRGGVHHPPRYRPGLFRRGPQRGSGPELAAAV